MEHTSILYASYLTEVDLHTLYSHTHKRASEHASGHS